MPTPFPTQFTNPLPAANDGLHERMAKAEARVLQLEALILQVTGGTAPIDSRYVRKTGDTMSGELIVQTPSATETVLSVINTEGSGGSAGSGGAAVLTLISDSASRYEWRIAADGAVDRMLFQDGGFNSRAWLQASGIATVGGFIGIGAPSGGFLPVLLHNSGAGRLLLTNLAQTDFDRLQFGGITAAFPALKRAATVLEVVLADDSARAQLYAATVRTNQTTVALLPAAATAGAGARAFVTDANATKAAGDGATVVGGGANKVPVYSDGTNWIIG